MGQYYDKMFCNAILSESNIIAVTSFNEWHEGTQIEPAIPKFISTFTYADYGELSPEYYLDRTRFWTDKFHSNVKVNLNKYLNDSQSIHHKLIGHTYLLIENPHNNYNNNRESILTDGKLGSTQYKDGNWMGFEKEDLNIMFALDSAVSISSIQLRFLHREDAWIFPPQSVELSISNDGIYFESIHMKKFTQIIQGDGGITEVNLDIPIYTRYISINAKNHRLCPPLHIGVCQPAWLFVDEVIVK